MFLVKENFNKEKWIDAHTRSCREILQEITQIMLLKSASVPSLKTGNIILNETRSLVQESWTLFLVLLYILLRFKKLTLVFIENLTHFLSKFLVSLILVL